MSDTWYDRYVVGMVSTNAYLLNGEYLVDPGGMNSDLKQDLRDHNNRIKGILLTHAHYDHIAGIESALEVIDCPIFCHEQDAEMLADPEQNLSLWTGETVAFEHDRLLSDGQELPLGSGSLKVIHTPGHTRGSVSFYDEESGLLFAGDTLFEQGIGRTDLPGGDQQQLLRSIRQKILTLPGNTTVLPGHGPETTVESEAHDNPFLG